MIRHCVMLHLSASADVQELQPIMDGLAAVVSRIDGISGFCAGPNRDFEGKSANFAYGFTLDAYNSKALQAYADDADHKALGARLVTLCEGGAQGIVVYDIEVTA